MAPDVRLRDALLGEDEEFAFRTWEEALRPVLEPIGKWDEARERRQMEEWIAGNDVSVICGEGTPVGVVVLRHTGEAFDLKGLMIRSEFRGVGYGRLVVESLLALADSSGLPIRLRVMKTNPRVREFYKRLGFVPDSETERHAHLVHRPEAHPIRSPQVIGG